MNTRYYYAVRGLVVSVLWLLLLLPPPPTQAQQQQQQQQKQKRGTQNYHNARIYTVRPEAPWADSMVVQDGVIVRVGGNNNTTAKDDFYVDATVYDLGGRLLLPGWHDVHLHAVEAGINQQLCFVFPDTPIEELGMALQDCPDNGAFGGQGWNIGVGIDLAIVLEELEWSTVYPIEVLDETFPNTPVVILDNLGHGCLVNTEALSRTGLLQMTSDPAGGQVLRDENGLLLGVVTENTQQVFRDAAFPPSSANQDIAYNSLLDALDTLNQYGITSVSDAGGFWRQAQVEAWDRALQNNQLTVRASNALYIYPDSSSSMDQLLTSLLQRYSNDHDSLVRFNQAKLYVDGILGLTTAALYEPYLERAGSGQQQQQQRGFEYFGTSDRLNTVVQTLVDDGFQMHFHTVGDRGVGLALDAIGNLTNRNVNGPHRLTHCYMVDERDRARFKELNVVADFQLAASSISSDYQTFMSNDILGPERANQILPAKELYNAGALVTLSSDWDADDLSPFVKIQNVLGRPDGRSFESVQDVIPMMTINAATLLQQNDKVGSIEVGKEADFIVVNQNIFEIPVNQIGATRVDATVLQGEVVFGSLTETTEPPPSSGCNGCPPFVPFLAVLLAPLLNCLRQR